MNDPEFIYKVLAEHKLDDRANLRHRVEALDVDEINTILDQLDKWYGQFAKPQPVSRTQVELEALRKQVTDLREEMFKLSVDSAPMATDDAAQAVDRKRNLRSIRHQYSPPTLLASGTELYTPKAINDAEQTDDRKMTPLTFTFPVLPPHHLPSIAKYALVADTVYLDDPVYDSFANLIGFDGPTIENALHDWGINIDVAKRIGNEVLYANKVHKATVDNVVKNISHILEMRDLMASGRIVLFKDLYSPFYSGLLQSSVYHKILADKTLTRSFGLTYLSNWSKLRLLLLSRIIPVRDPVKLMRSLTSPEKFAAFASLQPTIVSLWTFGIYNPHGMSTDLISPDLSRLHRLLIREVTSWNRALPPDEQIRLPVQPSQNVPKVLLIDGIPLERVIDAYLMEAQAFDYYRQALNEKLLSISSPPGTIEREKELAQIEQSIAREMTAIEMASRSIQRQFVSRFSLGVALSVAGVVVTGLGTGVAETTPLAVAGSAAGASAIVAGAREVIKELLDHQKENAAIRQNPNYFVWRAKRLKDSGRSV